MQNLLIGYSCTFQRFHRLVLGNCGIQPFYICFCQTWVCLGPVVLSKYWSTVFKNMCYFQQQMGDL